MSLAEQVTHTACHTAEDRQVYQAADLGRATASQPESRAVIFALLATGQQAVGGLHCSNLHSSLASALHSRKQEARGVTTTSEPAS